MMFLLFIYKDVIEVELVIFFILNILWIIFVELIFSIWFLLGIFINSIFLFSWEIEELFFILYLLVYEVKVNKDIIEKKSLFMFIYVLLLFFVYKGIIYNLVIKIFY